MPKSVAIRNVLKLHPLVKPLDIVGLVKREYRLRVTAQEVSNVKMQLKKSDAEFARMLEGKANGSEATNSNHAELPEIRDDPPVSHVVWAKQVLERAEISGLDLLRN